MVIGASMIGFFLVTATIVVVMLDISWLGASETFGYLDDGRKVMDMLLVPSKIILIYICITVLLWSYLGQ